MKIMEYIHYKKNKNYRRDKSIGKNQNLSVNWLYVNLSMDF